jgi:hypothetical protein
MWKWGIGAVGAMVIATLGLGVYLSNQIYLRPGHASIKPADMARKFSPEDLKADFNALTTMIEHVHPNIAAVVDTTSYMREKADVLARLDHPMTRLEFARLASAVNGVYRDGHTGLWRPREEWQIAKAGGTVLPLLVAFDDAGITILRGIDRAEIPADAQLDSVNGVAAAELRDWITDRVSGESLAFRRAYAAETFAVQVWEFGLSAPFVIKWRAPRTTAESEIVAQGVSFDEWDKARATLGADAYRLEITGPLAHLVISSFDRPPADFKSFLRSAFTRIRDQHVTSLVLDLRQNTGGDSRQGDLLQTFLSEDNLPALAEVAVKATPEVKARYKTLLPEGFRWIPLNSLVPMLRGIQNTPDGGFYRFHPDASTPQSRWFNNPLLFKGDLYVLISPVTYSSAVIFAAPLKYWKRAVFIGETSGEPLTFYGDNYEFDLPNTKLQASVSHKEFKLLGAKEPDVGLEPDIRVTPETPDAYQLALREIARRSAG